jgi:hypothetical protein
MKLPNFEHAVIDIRKLQDYCLNPHHDEGKHKARVFISALGMTTDDAEELREILLNIVQSHEAQLGFQDIYGPRYTVDFQLDWRDKQAQIRSAWIIEAGDTIPRLTRCYVL